MRHLPRHSLDPELNALLKRIDELMDTAERLHRTTQALMEEFLRNRDRLDRREPRKKPRT